MAANNDPRPGSGATVAFTTNDFAVRATSISHSGVSRPALDTTYLGSTNAKEFIPGDLYDPGEITVEYQANPNLLDDLRTHLIAAATDTITITFDQESGEATNAASFSATAFITDADPISISDAEELITGSFTAKLSGDITYTDAA